MNTYATSVPIRDFDCPLKAASTANAHFELRSDTLQRNSLAGVSPFSVLRLTRSVRAIKTPNLEERTKSKMRKAFNYQHLSTARAQRKFTSALSTALLVAVLLVSNLSVKAQVQCLAKCEQDYALCLFSSVPGSTCLELYEACTEGCWLATPLFE